MKNAVPVSYSDYLIEHRSGLFVDYYFHSENSGRIGTVPHSHASGEFILCCLGSSVFITGDRLFPLRAPYIIYCPPHVVHEQTNEYPLEYSRYNMLLPPSDSYTQYGDMLRTCFAFELAPEAFDRLEAVMSLICRFYHTNNPAFLPDTDLSETQRETLSDVRRRQLLLLFLDELYPIYGKYANKTADIDRCSYISDVKEYIAAHYASKLTLNGIAEQFYISRAKLTHDFREVLKMSVCDYITRVRLNQSKLLLNGNRPIAEIADLCGFSSASHYISVFVQYNDVTPAAFRAQISRIQLQSNNPKI